MAIKLRQQIKYHLLEPYHLKELDDKKIREEAKAHTLLHTKGFSKEGGKAMAIKLRQQIKYHLLEPYHLKELDDKKIREEAKAHTLLHTKGFSKEGGEGDGY